MDAGRERSTRSCARAPSRSPTGCSAASPRPRTSSRRGCCACTGRSRAARRSPRRRLPGDRRHPPGDRRAALGPRAARDLRRRVAAGAARHRPRRTTRRRHAELADSLSLAFLVAAREPHARAARGVPAARRLRLSVRPDRRDRRQAARTRPRQLAVRARREVEERRPRFEADRPSSASGSPSQLLRRRRGGRPGGARGAARGRRRAARRRRRQGAGARSPAPRARHAVARTLSAWCEGRRARFGGFTFRRIEVNGQPGRDRARAPTARLISVLVLEVAGGEVQRGQLDRQPRQARPPRAGRRYARPAGPQPRALLSPRSRGLGGALEAGERLVDELHPDLLDHRAAGHQREHPPGVEAGRVVRPGSGPDSSSTNSNVVHISFRSPDSRRHSTRPGSGVAEPDLDRDGRDARVDDRRARGSARPSASRSSARHRLDHRMPVGVAARPRPRPRSSAGAPLRPRPIPRRRTRPRSARRRAPRSARRACPGVVIGVSTGSVIPPATNCVEALAHLLGRAEDEHLLDQLPGRRRGRAPRGPWPPRPRHLGDRLAVAEPAVEGRVDRAR